MKHISLAEYLDIRDEIYALKCCNHWLLWWNDEPSDGFQYLAIEIMDEAY